MVWVKRVLLGLFIFTAIGAGLFSYASWVTEEALNKPGQLSSIPEFQKAMLTADLKLGQRTVHIRTGCADCHGSDLGGKTFLDDPAFGQVYAPNLTPAALQAWSDDEIAAAIVYGRHRDGRALVMMPANEYVNFNVHDLSSVIAYLRSVPSVERAPGKTTVGPVAKLLYGFGQLPTFIPAHIIGDRVPSAVEQTANETAEFGEYLARTSCMGCHGEKLEGGPIPGGPPEWPPATNLRFHGRDVWTEESFVRALKTGVSPETHQPIRLPMPIQQTKELDEVELKALWRFLSSLKGEVI